MLVDNLTMFGKGNDGLVAGLTSVVERAAVNASWENMGVWNMMARAFDH